MAKRSVDTAYKTRDPPQLLLVATILGAFSMSGVVAILVGPNRDTLHRFLFFVLCIASLSFIFATALDAVLLPATARKANLNLTADKIEALSSLCDGVVWAVILGAVALVTAIGSFGFVFSRRLGFLVAAAAVTVAVVLFLHFRALSVALS